MAKIFRIPGESIPPLDVCEFVVAAAYDDDFIMTSTMPAQLLAKCFYGAKFRSRRYWYWFAGVDRDGGSITWQRNYVGATVGGADDDGTSQPVDLREYAKLQDPAFTGVPTAPTITDLAALSSKQLVNLESMQNYLRAVMTQGVTLRVQGSLPTSYTTLQAAINAIPNGSIGIITYNITQGSGNVTINKDCIIYAAQTLPTTFIQGIGSTSVKIYGNLRTTDRSKEATLYYNNAQVELFGDVRHTAVGTNSSAIIGYPAGSLTHRGDIYLDSDNSDSCTFASSPSPGTSTNPPMYRQVGNQYVLNKGMLGKYKGPTYLDGLLFSRDLGMDSVAYKHYMRVIIDMRESTNATPYAVRCIWGSYDKAITTFYAGSSLLCPPGVDVLTTGNKPVTQQINFSQGVTFSKVPTPALATAINTEISFIDDVKPRIYTDTANGNKYTLVVENGFVIANPA